MIMHELKTELITFVNRACQCPLCASSPILENIVRRVASTRCMVRAKNYPPQHALLDVGFMTILRRTDCFILIWACSAVLTEPHNCHFQIVPASKQNPNKNRNVVLSCCHVVPRKRCLWSCMVGLTQLTTPREWSTIRITDPVGVKG